MELILVGLLHPVWYLLPFVIAGFVAWKSPATWWRKLTMALIILVVVGLNARLPTMLRDLVAGDLGVQERWVKRQAEIGPNDALFLESNIEFIQFRKNGADVLGIGGNEGCGCMYFERLEQISEPFPDTFLDNDIPYSDEGNTRYRFVLTESRRDGVIILAMDLYERSEKIASERHVFRDHFPREDDWIREAIPPWTKKSADGFAKRRPPRSLKNLLLYIANANGMQHLAGIFYRHTSTPVADFLRATIKLAPSPTDPRYEQVAEAEILEHGNVTVAREFFPTQENYSGRPPTQYFCHLDDNWAAPMTFFSPSTAERKSRYWMALIINGKARHVAAHVGGSIKSFQTAACTPDGVVGFRYAKPLILARRYDWNGRLIGTMTIKLPDAIHSILKTLPGAWIAARFASDGIRMELILYDKQDVAKIDKRKSVIVGGHYWQLKIPQFEGTSF